MEGEGWNEGGNVWVLENLKVLMKKKEDEMKEI